MKVLLSGIVDGRPAMAASKKGCICAANSRDVAGLILQDLVHQY